MCRYLTLSYISYFDRCQSQFLLLPIFWRGYTDASKARNVSIITRYIPTNFILKINYSILRFANAR